MRLSFPSSSEFDSDPPLELLSPHPSPVLIGPALIDFDHPAQKSSCPPMISYIDSLSDFFETATSLASSSAVSTLLTASPIYHPTLFTHIHSLIQNLASCREENFILEGDIANPHLEERRLCTIHNYDSALTTELRKPEIAWFAHPFFSRFVRLSINIARLFLFVWRLPQPRQDTLHARQGALDDGLAPPVRPNTEDIRERKQGTNLSIPWSTRPTETLTRRGAHRHTLTLNTMNAQNQPTSRQ